MLHTTIKVKGISAAMMLFFMASSMYASPGEIKLSAKKIDIGVMLKWSTETEAGADIFVLEKSTDGKEFELIAEITPTGTSLEGSQYSFVDLFPESEKIFYRLKTVFTDGRATAYQPVQASKVPITKFVISKMNTSAPTDYWAVNLEVIDAGSLVYELSSMDNLLVDRGIERVQEGYNELSFSLADWPDGVYTLTMEMLEDKKSLTIQKLGTSMLQVNNN